MGDHYLAVIILCVLGMLLQAVFIYSEYKRNMFAAVFLKGAASLIFVVIGFIGYKAVGQTEISRLVLFGLILGAAGDILLNIRYLTAGLKTFFFVTGTIAFFAGHIMYLAALIMTSDCFAVSAAVAAGITVILWIIVERKTIVALPLKILGGLYIAAVVFMACVAVGNAVSVCSTGRILFAAGAVLFLISDMILILNTFGKNPKMFWSGICLSLYYPGQLLIALAVGFGL